MYGTNLTAITARTTYRNIGLMASYKNVFRIIGKRQYYKLNRNYYPSIRHAVTLKWFTHNCLREIIQSQHIVLATLRYGTATVKSKERVSNSLLTCPPGGYMVSRLPVVRKVLYYPC